MLDSQTNTVALLINCVTPFRRKDSSFALSQKDGQLLTRTEPSKGIQRDEKGVVSGKVGVALILMATLTYMTLRILQVAQMGMCANTFLFGRRLMALYQKDGTFTM